MVKIKEAIVVEGKYDKNTLRQLVDTAVFQTDGFGVMKNKELLAFLRQYRRGAAYELYCSSGKRQS